MERRPLSFFVNGAVALVALFGVTWVLDPGPPVYAVRAMIGVGLALIGLKLLLRRFDIDFPPRRGRSTGSAKSPD